MIATMTIGPTYPPSRNAPIEKTVAMMALVSGLRR